MADLHEADAALFALSYDEPDALAAFADEYGITYPLLSDPDSEIIRRFGILNTLIDPDDHPWFGIPFPGSYVVDAAGTITAKFFEANLGLRATGRQLLRAAAGEDVRVAPTAERFEDVTADVRLDADHLAPGMLADLVVRLRVPAGQHVYGVGVPEGMVATSVDLDDDLGLVRGPLEAPTTSLHALAGTDESLPVHEGDVVLRLPVTHNGRHVVRHDDGSRTVRIAGTVRWQACDDLACHLPQRHRFDIEVPTARLEWPEFDRADDSERMDFGFHFARLTERQT